MKALSAKLHRFLTSEDGPTAVEYAVMVSLIIVACIGAINGLSGKIQSTFSSATSQM